MRMVAFRKIVALSLLYYHAMIILSFCQENHESPQLYHSGSLMTIVHFHGLENADKITKAEASLTHQLLLLGVYFELAIDFENNVAKGSKTEMTTGKWNLEIYLYEGNNIVHMFRSEVNLKKDRPEIIEVTPDMFVSPEGSMYQSQAAFPIHRLFP